MGSVVLLYGHTKERAHVNLYLSRSLTDEEKLQLLADVATMLRHQAKPRPKHNIMEFEGFAKEIWEGVDVEKYINEERNSWDG